MTFSMFGRIAGVAAIALVVAGCSRDWKTDYANGIDPAVSRQWNVRQITVNVPEELTVSDANTWAPQVDIVWHGDPAGDRKLQVAELVEDGIEQGSAALRGPRPVNIGVTMQRFHSITPRVEANLQNSGVHDIRYVIQVFDARSGAALTQPEPIAADIAALVGDQAREARSQGITQKDEIVPHIARVTAGWLGIGPDVRNKFRRLGR
ncbi:DUF6778 family protein [Falsirhodobacter xinxiangensis]|uniref:DUF6778 family protein n=1 Tax=Falsirhodobacter xinxiangensis TaxID=2530049 RepID=UPI001FE9EEE7|nr:DUF6778 family protein [Rhodobacter xinxiangensis]